MKLKISDVVDAIEKNGYVKILGTYLARQTLTFNQDDLLKNNREANWRLGVVGGCAIGQAGMNLNVDPIKLGDALKQVNTPLAVYYSNYWRWIVYLNDEMDNTLPQIAAIMRKTLREEQLETEFDV